MRKYAADLLSFLGSVPCCLSETAILWANPCAVVSEYAAEFPNDSEELFGTLNPSEAELSVAAYPSEVVCVVEARPDEEVLA